MIPILMTAAVHTEVLREISCELDSVRLYSRPTYRRQLSVINNQASSVNYCLYLSLSVGLTISSLSTRACLHVRATHPLNQCTRV